MENNKSAFLTLPVAIIIAGAIIAIAIIWTRRPVAPIIQEVGQKLPEVTMRPISSADHIFGNPDAAIKIVEYSDPSCPYCKVFTPTMEKVMDTYGASGTVAWVYRSFPLDKPDADGNIPHKNAGHESQAMECAADIGGNTKYWLYLRRLYEVTPSVTGQTPNGLDQTQLPVIAKYAGLDVAKFNDCLASGKFKDKVEADYTDGINIGITGTPTSVMVFKDGIKDTTKDAVLQLVTQNPSLASSVVVSRDSKKIIITGALPFQIIQLIIDTQLAVK